LRFTLRRWFKPRAAAPATKPQATAIPATGPAAEAAAPPATATVFTAARAVGAAGRPFVPAFRGLREPLGAVAGVSGPATASEGPGDTFSGLGVVDVSTLAGAVVLASDISLSPPVTFDCDCDRDCDCDLGLRHPLPPAKLPDRRGCHGCDCGAATITRRCRRPGARGTR